MGEEENFAFQCQRDKRKTRIELVTYRAAIDCSTTELFPLKVRRVGLNYRPSGHEPDTLPTELHRMVTLTGVEPATSGLWVRHSPVELQCIAWISTIQSPMYLLLNYRYSIFRFLAVIEPPHWRILFRTYPSMLSSIVS